MIYVITTLIVFSICYYLRYGDKVKMHKNIPLYMIKRYIEILYFRGFDRSGIVIDSIKRIEGIQFAKFLNEEEDIIIHFLYPIVDQSRKNLDYLKKVLSENNYKYSIEKESTGYNLEMLVVEFKDGVEVIANFAIFLFRDLFGFENNDLVKIYFTNVSTKIEIIGRTKSEPSEDFFKKPSIAMSNAEHWGLEIGRFVGSFLRIILPKRSK